MPFRHARRPPRPAGTPVRPLRLASAAAALLLAAATHAAQPRERAEESDAPRAPSSPERREPWPLRPDPLPGLEGSSCPADAHCLFRVGGLALRLGPGMGWSADPV